MKFIPTSIPDIILIEPSIFGDERGLFMETFRAKQFAEAGIATEFIQDNHSGSRQGALRGLHYQIRQAQGKLLRVVAGEIYDVAVDIRRSSTSFGRWEGIYLSAQNRHQVWIPPGFAHGFYVLSDWAEVIYKTTDYYAPQWERTILWNDADIAIQWPLIDGAPPTLSAKDTLGKRLREAELFD
ncbi:MAG: dTDP-4-dehydrorhamnose 3,5-epimerase [Chloroflexi bacterium RBG_16_52_11]|nr:MAG: dTDP-4-dehydrorhamnose 3,5-epimerase [Chloroflexi bacterium RBG_16_52_11]